MFQGYVGKFLESRGINSQEFPAVQVLIFVAGKCVCGSFLEVG